jgi:ABC-type Fe3+ transport system permease subunit
VPRAPITTASARPWGLWTLAALLAVISTSAVLAPIAGAVLGVLRLSPGDAPVTEMPPFAWGALGTTLLVCTAIGVVSAGLGLPAAWTLRRAHPAWVALICVPLLLPTYLAYTGWGLLRGPGTWIGDWIGRGPPARATAVNWTLGIGGVALWSAPIAALVIGAGARRLPAPLLDALALEPLPAPRRAWHVVRMLRAHIVAAAGLVTVIAAGSAVPLHLAQVFTYAIWLWKYLTLTPAPATVWPAAGPLLLGLLGVSVWIVRALLAPRPDSPAADDPADRPIPAVARGLALGVWLLGAGVPLGLFVWALKSWRSVGEFWVTQRGALGASLEVGAAVGLIVAALCLCTWALLACAPPRSALVHLVRLAAALFCFAALVPGVLVGQATLALWNAPGLPHALGDSALPLVLAHAARFGFLGVLAGIVLARQESADERDARLMAAGPSLRGFLRLQAMPALTGVVGLALAAAALSVHEIESSVQVQPPGRPGLAQHLLDLLHYARDEALAAACICLLSGGTLVALLAGSLISLGLRPRTHRAAPPPAEPTATPGPYRS